MSHDTTRHFASPPCSMHEVEPGYGGPASDSAPADWHAWRVQQRRQLLQARMALGQEARAAHARRIITQLRPKLDADRVGVISFFWPMRGEPDLRPLLGELSDAGVRCALPVVVKRGEPLVFRGWAPGQLLTRGVWNIPVPARGEVLTPDIVIAPVIGFDRGRYRLGYGGGYFDRTLAAFSHEPLVIGVGYPNAALATIHPQPHDIPMHRIVTGQAGPHPEPSE